MATNTNAKRTASQKTQNTQKTQKTQNRKAADKTEIKWNNVRGVMDLYAREVNLRKNSFMSFSTSIGKKNENDEYDNIYFDVLFKKNEAPDVDEGRFKIKIRSGFLTLSVYKDGSVHPAVMVMEYDAIFDDEDEDEDEVDEDLPF